MRLVQNRVMDAELRPVVAALAGLDAAQLGALIETVNDSPDLTPGLLAWIEHLADWEINRRGGVDFPLRAPDAAIDPSEDASSIAAAAMLRALFAQDERLEARGVAVLLDAVVGVLTGIGNRH